MNLCIIYGKWYIYKCKKDNNNLCILDFIKIVKEKLILEKTLSNIKQDKCFEEKWEDIFNEL